MALFNLPFHVSTNDALLFGSLLYSVFDIVCDWEAFSACYRPIHVWLIISYATVTCYRCIHLMGSHASRQESTESGHFLLNVRQKGALSCRLFEAMWLFAVPAFVLWTLLGSWWLWEINTYTPGCLPEGVLALFVYGWQIISYAWILVHAALGTAAWVLERRVRSAESTLHELADADLVSRWGANFSQLPGYGSLPSATAGRGLSPAALQALPPAEPYCGPCGAECAICLVGFEPGEQVRTLCGCGHAFHRSCIDLWLLRRADCPLCKRQVGMTKEADVEPPAAAERRSTEPTGARRRTAAAA